MQCVRHVEGGVPGAGMAVEVSFEWPRHLQKECDNVCVQIRQIRCHGELNGVSRNGGWSRRWWDGVQNTGVVMEGAMKIAVGADA